MQADAGSMSIWSNIWKNTKSWLLGSCSGCWSVHTHCDANTQHIYELIR